MAEAYIMEPDHPGARIAQIALFKQIWLLSNRRSFLTGLYLREYFGTDLFLNLFAHVLPKAGNKYPYFKYYARNIVLLTPGEHALYDQGTAEARITYALEVEEKSGGKCKADWAKLEALAEDLKKEYKKVFPTTVGIIIGVKYTPEEVFDRVGKLNRAYWDSLRQKT